MERLTPGTLLADPEIIGMSRMYSMSINFFWKFPILYLYVVYPSTLETEKMVMRLSMRIINNLILFYSKFLYNTQRSEKRHIIVNRGYGERRIFFFKNLVYVLCRIVAPVITEKPEKHQPRRGKRNMVLLEYLYLFLNFYFANVLHDNIIRLFSQKSKNQKLIYFKNNYEFH